MSIPDADSYEFDNGYNLPQVITPDSIRLYDALVATDKPQFQPRGLLSLYEGLAYRLGNNILNAHQIVTIIDNMLEELYALPEQNELDEGVKREIYAYMNARFPQIAVAIAQQNIDVIHGMVQYVVTSPFAYPVDELDVQVDTGIWDYDTRSNF